MGGERQRFNVVLLHVYHVYRFPNASAITFTDTALVSSIPNHFLSQGSAAASAANGVSYAWQWYLKRWACGRILRASPDAPYDVVITTRPDIVFFRPWRIARHATTTTTTATTATTTTTPTSSDGGSGGGRTTRRSHYYTVAVGGPDASSTAFGEGELVAHDFSFACMNDWLSISTCAVRNSRAISNVELIPTCDMSALLSASLVLITRLQQPLWQLRCVSNYRADGPPSSFNTWICAVPTARERPTGNIQHHARPDQLRPRVKLDYARSEPDLCSISLVAGSRFAAKRSGRIGYGALVCHALRRICTSRWHACSASVGPIA